MERTFLCVDLHLRDAFPHLSGCPLFWQHELYVGIIHPTDFVIEPKKCGRSANFCHENLIFLT